MGFNVTALAQKARTQTLIVDSDLDMGQYDIIATDVKGDTAEFSEFVGGVGNFTSGLFSSGVDVSGILHAEGNTQVDGNIILEGSINNVNIADDGEITTTKGVNGADFNGATITSTKFNGATIDASGNVTGAKGTFSGAVTGGSFNGVVLKSSGAINVSNGSNTFYYLPSINNGGLLLLPPRAGCVYSGSITVKATGSSSVSLYYYDGVQGSVGSGNPPSISVSTAQAYTFNNIPYLIMGGNYVNYVQYRAFTLS